MLLKDLCNLAGTSGNEEVVREYILSEASSHIDHHWIDSIGNLYLHKKGQSCSKKMILLAHMDEVGFMVKHIDKNGMIRFANVGGIETSVLPAKRVLIHGKETLRGVIGIKPIHAQHPKEHNTVINKDSLYIDTGASSAEELKKTIQAGDAITFDTAFAEHGDLWRAKAFDDRAGCAVLLETLKKHIDPAYDVYYVFCVQEEVGLRGSQIAGQRIQADIAFVFEGTTASDIPLLPPHRWTTRLGKGPAVTIAHHGLVFQKDLLLKMANLAQENNLPFQWKEKIAGGNDATALSKAGTGCSVGSISLPVRYIHSPHSLMHPYDYQATLKFAELLVSHANHFISS